MTWVYDTYDWTNIRQALGYGGIGGGFGGYWYCTGCGNPQLGDPPFGKVFGVRDRCRPCGPGRGYARCPATHRGGQDPVGAIGGPCVLCRGEGWVEELV